jgi:hypothetical protein
MWRTHDQTVAAGYGVTPAVTEGAGGVAGSGCGSVWPGRAPDGTPGRSWSGCWLICQKNYWTLAEHAGDASSDGMQHQLAGAVWDEHAVREDVSAYLVEHVTDPAAVLEVDETGLQEGHNHGWVQRQYTALATDS